MDNRVVIRNLIIGIVVVLLLIVASIYMWNNTYQFHALKFSGEDWYNILHQLNDGPWICEENRIQFNTIDDLTGEGSLESIDGRNIDFDISFDYSPSLYLSFEIEGNWYEAMGYINDDGNVYTVVFNNKNWPYEYFGGENRELVFTLEE